MLKRLFRKRNVFPTANAEIVFAFRSGNIDYYQFSDISNIPAVRGLKTTVFFEEMKMKCTLDYLKLHCEAIDNILSKQRINIFDIKKLNDQLKQRLTIAVDHEIVYKIASIVFFDRTEDTRDYDFQFNSKKIEHWKKHHGNDFFLLQPLRTYLPFLNDANVNSQTYFQAVEKLNRLHLENLLPKLPASTMQKLKDRSYFSAAVMPPDTQR